MLKLSHLKPHHLNGLPDSVAADVKSLLSINLQEDVCSAAITNLLMGQSLNAAIKNARSNTWREVFRPSGFVSFDDKSAEGLSLHETCLVEEEEDEKKERKLIFLDSATESLMKILEGGTVALGKQLGVGQRRAQQLLKAEIARRLNGSYQADLFGECQHEY